MAQFPTVGVIGAGQLARMMIAPAIALGVNLKVFAQSKEDSAALNTDYVIGSRSEEHTSELQSQSTIRMPSSA